MGRLWSCLGVMMIPHFTMHVTSMIHHLYNIQTVSHCLGVMMNPHFTMHVTRMIHHLYNIQTVSHCLGVMMIPTSPCMSPV